MSDAPTKTYPPEFLEAMIADHEAERAGATPEESSAVQAKGDAMSEIKRFDIPRHGNECMHEDPDGEYVQYDDHQAEMKRLTAERDEVEAEVEQLWRDLTAADGTIDGLRTELAEQDCKLETAQAEVERLKAEVKRQKAERDQMATHPRGREVGRFGLDGHYLDAMEPERPTDEDIWREAFITMLPSFPWEKAAEKSDCVLVEYRKRWPR